MAGSRSLTLNDLLGMAFLPIQNSEAPKKLAVKAIQFFVPLEKSLALRLPELRFLDCRDMGLISLDLSSIPQLIELNCDNNQLSKLDLSAIPNLKDLACRKNKLTELDLLVVPQLSVLV